MRRVAPILALALLACGNGHDPRAPVDRGPVVAEVNGVPIHLPELEDRMRHDGVAPREALKRLVDEELTIEAARRLGLHPDDDLVFTRQRAAVQALLTHEVEEKVRAEDLTETDIARGYESGRTLEADHVLAKTGAKASETTKARARALAVKVGEAAKRVTTREEFRALATSLREPGVSLTTEDLGKFPRDGRFVPAFEENVFRMTRAGEVSPPFETEFGWHVVRVRAVDNVFGDSLGPARAKVVEKLVTLRRRVAFEALLRRLQAAAHVDVDDASLRLLDPPP